MNFNLLFKTWNYQNLDNSGIESVLNLAIRKELSAGYAWKNFHKKIQENDSIEDLNQCLLKLDNMSINYRKINKLTDKEKNEFVSLLSKLSEINQMNYYIQCKPVTEDQKKSELIKFSEAELRELLSRKRFLPLDRNNILSIIESFNNRDFFKIFEALAKKPQEIKILLNPSPVVSSRIAMTIVLDGFNSFSVRKNYGI